MTNPDPFRSYLADLQNKLATGGATEHTHRSTLEALIEALGDGIQAINEPKRIACGAPDLAVLRDGLLVGHIEPKDIGKPLDVVDRSDQLIRYRRSLGNLILIDYLEFRWYVAGESAEGDLRRSACLGRLDVNGQIIRESAGRGSPT